MNKKQIMLILTICAAAAVLILLWLNRDARAADIRLAKAEGLVEVLDQTKTNLSVREQMKLLEGYSVSTGGSSAAYLSLDNAKAAKLDAHSCLILDRAGKKLALRLTEGKLFFHIAEPLAEDEQFEIRTSSAILGIRGTAGFLEVLDEDTASFHLLTGKASVSAVSPVTGTVKEIDILPGQRVTALIREAAENEERLELILENFQQDDIPDFVNQELDRDPSLRERMQQETLWGLSETIILPSGSQEDSSERVSRPETGWNNESENVSTDFSPDSDESPGFADSNYGFSDYGQLDDDVVDDDSVQSDDTFPDADDMQSDDSDDGQSDDITADSDDSAADDTSSDDTSLDDDSADDTSSDDDSVDDTSSDDDSVDDTSSDDDSVDDTSSNDDSVDDTSSNDDSVDDTSSNDDSVDDTSSDDDSVDDTSSDDDSVDDQPSDMETGSN